MPASCSGTLSWKIIPRAQHGRRPAIPRHQYDLLQCELSSSVLVGYEPTRAPRAATASPVVYLLVASMGEVRRLNRHSLAIETAPSSGLPAPQNEYVVLTAATEEEAQMWLDALCDAVEQQQQHNISVPSAHPPTRPPHSYSEAHQYAPPPPSVPNRCASVRFTDAQDEAERMTGVRGESQSCLWLNVSDRANDGDGGTDHPTAYRAQMCDEWDHADLEKAPYPDRGRRWQPNPKPLLSDVVHGGVYPSHEVLAPAIDELVAPTNLDLRSGGGDTDKSPLSANDRPRSRGARRSTGRRQSASPRRFVEGEDEGDDRRKTAPCHRASTSRLSSSPTRADALAPSPDRTNGHRNEASLHTEHGSRVPLPLSRWRWGPVQPGPAVPAIVAIAADDADAVGGGPAAIVGPITTTQVGTSAFSSPGRRASLAPVIHYALPSARTRYALSPTHDRASALAASPTRWTSSRSPSRFTALVPFAAPHRKRSPFPWRGALAVTDRPREGSRHTHGDGGKRRTSRHTHRRHADDADRYSESDDDDDDDDEYYYRSSRHAKNRGSRSRHSARSSSRRRDKQLDIEDENVAFLCCPRLFLKYDAQADSGRPPSLHYVFLTVDQQHLVAVPAQRFESAISEAGIGKPTRGRSASRAPREHPVVAVRSLERALRFFGKTCTAISLRSVLRVRRGCDEPMILDDPAESNRFVDKGCVVCITSTKHAFLFESKSQEEATNVVAAFEAVLAEGIR